jgi:hypothetical protein
MHTIMQWMLSNRGWTVHLMVHSRQANNSENTLRVGIVLTRTDSTSIELMNCELKTKAKNCENLCFTSNTYVNKYVTYVYSQTPSETLV